jgi:hypothetical protein
MQTCWTGTSLHQPVKALPDQMDFTSHHNEVESSSGDDTSSNWDTSTDDTSTDGSSSMNNLPDLINDSDSNGDDANDSHGNANHAISAMQQAASTGPTTRSQVPPPTRTSPRNGPPSGRNSPPYATEPSRRVAAATDHPSSSQKPGTHLRPPAPPRHQPPVHSHARMHWFTLSQPHSPSSPSQLMFNPATHLRHRRL